MYSKGSFDALASRAVFPAEWHKTNLDQGGVENSVDFQSLNSTIFMSKNNGLWGIGSGEDAGSWHLSCVETEQQGAQVKTCLSSTNGDFSSTQPNHQDHLLFSCDL